MATLFTFDRAMADDIIHEDCVSAVLYFKFTLKVAARLLRLLTFPHFRPRLILPLAKFHLILDFEVRAHDGQFFELHRLIACCLASCATGLCPQRQLNIDAPLLWIPAHELHVGLHRSSARFAKLAMA